jgi:hypothetical protein
MATPPPPPDRGPVPVYAVARAQAPVEIDGTLKPEEWFGLGKDTAMVVEQSIRGDKLKPKTYAWMAHDDKNLYVAVRNVVDPGSKLRIEPVWGENDAVELAFRNPAVKGSSILLLRGYPGGAFEGSTEAGAPFEVAQDVERAATYAARIVSPSEWTAEWKIPFSAIGVDPAKQKRVEFNLSVRKTAGLQWMMWRGTLGYTWQVDKAGVLELK